MCAGGVHRRKMRPPPVTRSRVVDERGTPLHRVMWHVLGRWHSETSANTACASSGVLGAQLGDLVLPTSPDAEQSEPTDERMKNVHNLHTNWTFGGLSVVCIPTRSSKSAAQRIGSQLLSIEQSYTTTIHSSNRVRAANKSGSQSWTRGKLLRTP